MQDYNVKIENGIKSSLFSLNSLMKDQGIVNDKMLRITGELEQLVDLAQQGKIEYDIKAHIVTEKQLENIRKSVQ